MAAPGVVRTVISEREYSSAGFGVARSRQPARPNAHIPDATYRLQFRPEFGFAAARQIIPFLKQLGITHVYASPLFQARAGSPHGYDVTDQNCLNPQLGSEEEFDGFIQDLRANGMGLVVDIVPNHMSACGENAWWMDVLEDGPESAYANYFDVDWAAGMPGCENKVVLALLGDSYARTLEKQELKLGIDECGLHVRYWEHRFPLSLASYRTVLSHAVACRCGGPRQKCPAHMAFERLAAATAQLNGHRATQKNAIKAELWTLYQEHAEVRDLLHRILDSFNGTKGDLRSLQALDGLLGEQSFVLAYWRTGREHTNYRRFFDINDLVGVRVEEPEVFEATHALLFRLVREGKLAGVRIDHIDGLHDPKGYLRMLEERLRAEAPGGEFFVVAEKILLGYETLPADWPVCGTTGYDFLNAANAVFVDQRNLGRLTSTYEKFTGLERAFHEVVYAKKKLVMRKLFGNDLRRLGAKLCELALQVKETTAADGKGHGGGHRGNHGMPAGLSDLHQRIRGIRHRPWGARGCHREGRAQDSRFCRSQLRFRLSSAAAGLSGLSAGGGAPGMAAVRDAVAAVHRAGDGEGHGGHGLLRIQRAGFPELGRRGVAAGIGGWFSRIQRRPEPRVALHAERDFDARHEAQRGRTRAHQRAVGIARPMGKGVGALERVEPGFEADGGRRAGAEWE